MKDITIIIPEGGGAVPELWEALEAAAIEVEAALRAMTIDAARQLRIDDVAGSLQPGKDADLVVHECFIAVPELVSKMGFTPESALLVGTQVHTAPEAFGKVMSAVKPRMAVAYHFFKDFDTTAQVYERIRKTYDGPLSLAEDFMVWNITKDDIRVRMAVVEEHTWAPPLVSKPELPREDDTENYSKEMNVDIKAMGYSDFIKQGRWGAVDEANRRIYEEASETLGRKFEYPSK